MKLNEVRNTYFSFEDKKIIIIKEVQAFFLKNGFSPYVWVDENCLLHAKIKHRRGLSYSELNVFPNLLSIAKKVGEQIDSKIIWTQNEESWDGFLKGKNKVLCTTEFIYKPRGDEDE